MTSRCCSGTAPPSTRTRAPMPALFGAVPWSRIAIRGAGGVVAEHRRRFPEPVDDDVQVAVAVQVRERHRVRHVRSQVEAPGAAHVLEGEVAAVAERHVRQRQRRELEQHAMPVDLVEPVAQPVLGVAIHDVPQVAGADEDVFPPVEVHVEEQRGPGPPRGAHPGEARDLLERAVAPVQLQGVALHLGAVVALLRVAWAGRCASGSGS